MNDIKNVFVTGITGYIGGTIAVKLKEQGYAVTGLARKDADIAALKARGFAAVQGSLQDVDVLNRAIAAADAVIHTADSDDAAVADRFLSLLKNTGKTFIYTSGAAIVANWQRPETAEFVYTEDFPLEATGMFGGRLAIHNAILRAAANDVRSIVIVPGLVYGAGLLLATESKQIPYMVKTAKEKGHAVYVADGRQSWSNVHVEDLANLYIAALTHARAGSYFFAENGMTSFKDIAAAIHAKLGYSGAPHAMTAAESIACWGEMMATVALGSNCRITADKARALLPWKPQHTSPLSFI